MVQEVVVNLIGLQLKNWGLMQQILVIVVHRDVLDVLDVGGWRER